MTDPNKRIIAAGQDSAQQRFAREAEPLRRELKLHCYRMMGSLHEAEDLVQEAYARAWRAFDGFEGRGALKGWLYRIATNACLDALAARRRASRLLPDQAGPATREMPDGVPASDIAWLDPYPDSEIEAVPDEAPTPEARYAARESVHLAFIAIVQQLPPRQRAVLLLRDVLGWSARETAALLGGTVISINSALQRARDTLARAYPSGQPSLTTSRDATQHMLLERYVAVWEDRDLDGFVALLAEDAVYTMPPLRQWYRGRAAIRAFYARVWRNYDGFRLVPVGANRQPAFAAYSRPDATSPYVAHSLHVLAPQDGAIATLTLFVAPEAARLFAAFGLPLELAP